MWPVQGFQEVLWDWEGNSEPWGRGQGGTIVVLFSTLHGNSLGFGIKPELDSWRCHLVAVWPMATYLASLILSFPSAREHLSVWRSVTCYIQTRALNPNAFRGQARGPGENSGQKGLWRCGVPVPWVTAFKLKNNIFHTVLQAKIMHLELQLSVARAPLPPSQEPQINAVPVLMRW